MNRFSSLLCGFVLGLMVCWLYLDRATPWQWPFGHLASHDAEDSDHEYKPEIDDDSDTDNDDDNSDDEPEAPERSIISAGVRGVVLNAAEQARAGIEVKTLTPRQLPLEAHTVGSVVAVQELLSGFAVLAGIKQQQQQQAGVVNELRTQLKSLEAMTRSGRVGVSQEQARIRLAYQREQARAAELTTAAAQQKQTLVTRWGVSLITTLNKRAQLLSALERAELKLVEVVVPASLEIQAGREIWLDINGQRAVARKASMLAPAARAVSIRGQNWLASVPAVKWQAALRVDAWIPRPQTASPGILIPRNAVIWHGGQQWIYQRRNAGEFRRLRLPAAHAHPLGWLVEPSSLAAEELVISGAQSLLAEEFRAAIPVEDDD